MKMRSNAPMWVAKTGYIALSVFFIVAGALFIAFPAVSSKIVGSGQKVVWEPVPLASPITSSLVFVTPRS